MINIVYKRLSFLRKIREITQRTLMAGPGDKLKTNEIMKPNTDINNPNIDDLIIATRKLGAFDTPNNVGVDNKAITSITPTADIELTITKAVVKLRAKFNKETFIPICCSPLTV